MSTQIPEETLKQWEVEFEKYVEVKMDVTNQVAKNMISDPNSIMFFGKDFYLAAKTSSYERIFQLEEELRVMRNDKA